MPDATTPANNPAPAQLPGVFLDMLRTMSGGRSLVKFEDTLRAATIAAQTAGGKAKFCIEITVAPNGTGVGDVPLFKVAGKVKSRAFPEIADAASSYFVDDDGNLTQRNPHQTSLGLTALDGGAGKKITTADLKTAVGK